VERSEGELERAKRTLRLELSKTSCEIHYQNTHCSVLPSVSYGSSKSSVRIKDFRTCYLAFSTFLLE